jgi:8-oxo-dGTP pyrophosphatase MutT (NUDIX family)
LVKREVGAGQEPKGVRLGKNGAGDPSEQRFGYPVANLALGVVVMVESEARGEPAVSGDVAETEGTSHWSPQPQTCRPCSKPSESISAAEREAWEETVVRAARVVLADRKVSLPTSATVLDVEAVPVLPERQVS